MHVMYLGAGAVSGEYVWIPSFWCISKIIIAYALLEMAPMVSKSFFFFCDAPEPNGLPDPTLLEIWEKSRLYRGRLVEVGKVEMEKR